MKKIFVAICIIFSCVVHADTTLTSKNYVDSQVAPKQDIIPAKNTNTVLTHTGESGSIGEKGIYDSTGTYAGHSTELVTAGVADAAIQNAIDTEFVCVEWHENDEHTDANCLGWQIQNVFHKSKNLFNKDDPNMRNCWFSYGTNFIGKNFFTASCTDPGRSWYTSAPIPVVPNETYTVSNHTKSPNSGSNPSFLYLDENFIILDGFKNASHTRRTFTIPDNPDIKYVVIPLYGGQLDFAQFELGSTATAYQPYGNTYIPENQ